MDLNECELKKMFTILKHHLNDINLKNIFHQAIHTKYTCTFLLY